MADYLEEKTKNNNSRKMINVSRNQLEEYFSYPHNQRQTPQVKFDEALYSEDLNLIFMK